MTNVMSDRYTPLQNVDAFAFFDAVVGAGRLSTTLPGPSRAAGRRGLGQAAR